MLFAQMIMSDKLDPYEALKELLEKPRYDLVHNAYCRPKDLRPDPTERLII